MEIRDKAFAEYQAGMKYKEIAEKYGVFLSTAAGAGVETIPLLPALTYAWDPSGMKLSEKLHSASVEMRRKIIATIETQQKLNKGAIEVARELYEGYNSGKRVIYTQRLPQYLDKIYAYARQSDLSTREQETMLRLGRKAQKQTEKMGANGAPNQALETAYKQLLQTVDKSISMSLEKAVKTAIEEKAAMWRNGLPERNRPERGQMHSWHDMMRMTALRRTSGSYRAAILFLTSAICMLKRTSGALALGFSRKIKFPSCQPIPIVCVIWL